MSFVYFVLVVFEGCFRRVDLKVQWGDDKILYEFDLFNRRVNSEQVLGNFILDEGKHEQLQLIKYQVCLRKLIESFICYCHFSKHLFRIKLLFVYQMALRLTVSSHVKIGLRLQSETIFIL